MSRNLNYDKKAGHRYWWFQQQSEYIPPIFSFLTEREWKIIEEWYEETDARNSAGESNIPAMSILQGLIMGSRINNIVQLGHYEGFSSLLIGFMMKRMGFKNGFISVDIDPGVTAYTQKWVDKAGLGEYVKLIINDSSAPELVDVAKTFFNGEIKLVFIDSSHAYEHTINELELWYPALKRNGLIAMHDISGYATQFDYTGKGGVRKAVLDWCRKTQADSFLMNGAVPLEFTEGLSGMIYQDICGLGLIQKNY